MKNFLLGFMLIMCASSRPSDFQYESDSIFVKVCKDIGAQQDDRSTCSDVLAVGTHVVIATAAISICCLNLGYYFYRKKRLYPDKGYCNELTLEEGWQDHKGVQLLSKLNR